MPQPDTTAPRWLKEAYAKAEEEKRRAECVGPCDKLGCGTWAACWRDDCPAVKELCT